MEGVLMKLINGSSLTQIKKFVQDKKLTFDKRYIAMMITLVLSIVYIFAIDVYDQTPKHVTKLYEAIAVEGINYEQIEVNIKGVTENKEVPIDEIMVKENKCNEVLSHTKDCSKLCAIEHPVLGDVEVFAKEDYINATTSNTQDMSTYTLTIKNEERDPDTTIYNMKIQGLQDIGTIDYMRNKSIDLFKEWDTNPSETISFVGYVDGNLSLGQKENYKTQILKSLKGRFVDYYQDDYNTSTEAYYGYTPLVKDYTTTAKGAKTNTQITFTYNEVLNATEVIVAFPFYNAPY